ncbi:hypothetical protein [Streptomyces vastus]|uniref:Transmembrane protein PGPGW n=1 Tax=Streptomyces vastus TaxID=285451 RepID=A0ABP6DL65_9ACTN
MPVLSIRRRCAALVDQFKSFVRRNRKHLLLGGAALLVFVLVLLRPVLGTPIALALAVVTLRRKP